MNRIDFKIELTQDAKDVLDKVLSTLVPHEDYDKSSANTTAIELQKILPLTDVTGVYYILLKMLYRQADIASSNPGYKIALTEEAITTNLQIALGPLLLDPLADLGTLLVEHGLSNDLTDVDNLKKAQDFIYNVVMDKYDQLMLLAIPSDEAVPYLESLRDVLIQDLTVKGISIQASIMNDGVQIGRDVYVGAEGVHAFSRFLQGYIEGKFVDFLKSKTNKVSLTDLDSLLKFEKIKDIIPTKLYDWGYEPMDEIFSVMTSDIVTLVGDEGVGKTTFMVDQMYKSLMAGHDVLVMPGETHIASLLNDVIRLHLAKTHGYRVTRDEYNKALTDPNSELPEDVMLAINSVKADIMENPDYGRMHFDRDMTYEHFYKEVSAMLVRYPNIKAVFVDHIDNLTTTGGFTSNGYLRTPKERVDYLYRQAIDLKHDYEVMFMFLAHSSSNAFQAVSRGKDAGVRVGATSSATSKDADVVLYLQRDDNLQRQAMVRMVISKIRNYPIHKLQPFVLKRDPEVSTFEYSDDFQYRDSGVEDLSDKI